MPKQLELISGKQIRETPKEEAFVDRAKRNIKRLGYNIGEGILNVGQRLQKQQELTAQALSGQKQPQQLAQELQQFQPEPLLQKQLGLTKEQITPQGTGEEFLDVLAMDLPVAYALGGGSLLRRLGLGALGSASQFGAKKAGFGPFGQFIAGAGVPFLFSGFGTKKGAAQPESLRQKDITHAVEEFKRGSYSKAEKEALKAHENAAPLQKFINQEQKRAARVGSESNKKIMNDLLDFEAHITENKINIQDLWERKKFYNEQLSKDLPKGLSSYYERARNKAVEELNKYGKKNKIFGEGFQAGEESHKALKRADEARDFIKKNVDLTKIIKNPLSTSILFGIGKAKEMIPGYFSLLWNSPYAQKYAEKAVQAMFDENIPQFINNARALDQEVTKLQSKTKGKKNLEILSGGIATS